MKKIFTWMALTAIFFGGQVYADDVVGDVQDDLKGTGSYGMAGCGLGSMLFDDNTTTNQILAATTNGTFGTQTFGITSGSSNCTANGLVKLDKETEAFVEVNYDVLQKDIAQGQGETLVSFASLIGCDATPLGQTLQANYTQLSAADDSADFLRQVQQAVDNNPSACKS